MTALSQPIHGTLTIAANGSFTYTPNAELVGVESFTYRVTDGLIESRLITVQITTFEWLIPSRNRITQRNGDK